jgi:hypothetical protein
MYFEPSKKTYYRFPSSNSIQEMDSKYYFPDKPYASGENTRLEADVKDTATDTDNFLAIR